MYETIYMYVTQQFLITKETLFYSTRIDLLYGNHNLTHGVNYSRKQEFEWFTDYVNNITCTEIVTHITLYLILGIHVLLADSFSSAIDILVTILGEK